IADNEPPQHIAYLPTWEGIDAEQNYTSIEQVAPLLPDIGRLTGRTIVCKPHPLTGRRSKPLRNIARSLAKQAKSTEQLVCHDQQTAAVELMSGSAALISDISSVVSDFLITGRPLFVYMPHAAGI